MFVILTLVIVTSIVFSPGLVPAVRSTAVHGANLNVMAPAADLTGEPTSAAAPLQVDFTDGSTGTPTGWAWYFGDEAFNEPWTQMATAIEWTARYGHTSVALPDGSIVLMGGRDATGLRNDVWRSTDQGVTWTQMTAAAPWTGRRYHTSVALSDGSIVLMGGEDSLTAFDCRRDDVWRSTDQGATWTMMTNSAEWNLRSRHSSVVLPSDEGDDDSIFLMGGLFQYGLGGVTHISSSVWRSTDQGATWTQIMTAGAKWSGRYGHASVALPDGSIVLMGGRVDNDVWRSTDQGETWELMTAHAEWAARSYHTSVALPDGSIVLMGGGCVVESVLVRVNDVWRSTDQGATWTQMTSAAEWTPRYDHTSVVLPDGSIVLMGGSPGWGLQNDVWRSTNLGANWSTLPDELKIFLPLILR